MTSAPLFGYISDRIGRRRVLICSLLAFALANILTAGAANLPSLLAVRLFAGAAAAGVSPSIYALVGSAAPPERRATWLALVVSGLLVSLAIGASAGALVGVIFGGPPVFLALAGLGLVLVWLNRWVWPCDHGGAPAGPDAAVRDQLAFPVLVRRLIPTVMWSTGLYSVYTYLGAGLTAVGFSIGRTAAAILFYGCGAIIGVLVGGRVADRFGVGLTATASFAGLCACLLLLRLALDADRLVEPALGVSSAVAQLFFPAQQAGLANDFPRQRAAVLAWNNSALFLGISLGSLVGGEAIALGSFGADLVISAGISLAGCIINAILVPGRLRVRR
jgi:MFS transporter, DHA1 family, putative efflux transporter